MRPYCKHAVAALVLTTSALGIFDRGHIPYGSDIKHSLFYWSENRRFAFETAPTLTVLHRIAGVQRWCQSWDVPLFLESLLPVQ